MAYENEPFIKIKDGVKAPSGFHYMPSGRLMSDYDHINNHGYIEKKITDFIIDTKDINYAGETRGFSLKGDIGAYFNIEIHDDAGTVNYYNFSTNLFSTTKTKSSVIKLSSSTYDFSVVFPVTSGSLKKYTINITTQTIGNVKTLHNPLVEVRYADDTINRNSSYGSNSNVLTKTLYQDAAKSLYLSCVAPSLYSTSTVTVDGTTSSSTRVVLDQASTTTTSTDFYAVSDKLTGTGVASSVHALITTINPDNDNNKEIEISVADSFTNNNTYTVTPPFNGMTPHYTDSTSGRDTVAVSSGGSFKKSFSITCTAPADRVFSVNRVPTARDLCAISTVTFGSAASAISGENTSSDTVFHRWPVTNIANLTAGMALDPGRSGDAAETITPALISNYKTTQTLQGITENEYSSTITETIVDDIAVDGVDPNGNEVTAIDRNGRITARAGNITFNKQQVDALKTQADVRIFAHGNKQIKEMTGIEVSLSNIEITETQVSTTTTSGVSGSTTIPVADVGSVSGLPGVSSIRGIGIDSEAANPTVSSKSTNDGAGNLIASAAQTLESGQTLFIDGGSSVITITGSITVSNMAIADTTLYFDVERFLTCS